MVIDYDFIIYPDFCGNKENSINFILYHLLLITVMDSRAGTCING